MSSAAAVIGLTFRGTDIQQEDAIFLEIVGGLMDGREVRGVDLIVPSRAGQSVRNRVASRRSIELGGWIRGVDTGGEDADRSDLAANRAAFIALFDETLEPGALVATLEDGSVQTIDARTLNVIPVVRVPSFYDVSVALESVDPDWVAVQS
jgi:hypothetical protein